VICIEIRGADGALSSKTCILARAVADVAVIIEGCEQKFHAPLDALERPAEIKGLLLSVYE